MDRRHPQFDAPTWIARDPLAQRLREWEAMPESAREEYDAYRRSFVFGPLSLARDLQMRAALWPDLEPFRDWRENKHSLMIGDLGAMCLFWDGKRVVWEVQGG